MIRTALCLAILGLASSGCADAPNPAPVDSPKEEGPVIEQLRAVLTAMQKAGKPGMRGQHPKHHGFVWATFTVEEISIAEVRAGVFAAPRSYRALVRFSNGSAFDDKVPDVHGMAIKLFDVEGEKLPSDEKRTHDFVLADNPVFFARDAQHMLDFVRGLAEGKTAAQMVATHPKLVGFRKPAADSPSSMTYRSQTPYGLGGKAVKYVVAPSSRVPKPIPADATGEYLRLALVEDLKPGNAPLKFDFSVQLQEDAESMPIEDATVEWTSKPIKVATITIEPQIFDTPERRAAADPIEFTPWHCLSEQRPLGAINRVRKEVYLDSLHLRHQTNGTTHFEPDGKEKW